MIAAIMGWNWLNDEENNAHAEAVNKAMAPARSTQSPIQQAVAGDMGLMLKTAIFSLFGSKAAGPSATIDPEKLVTAGATGNYPGPVVAPPPQKVEGNVTIEIKAGELKNMIRAVVDENDQFNFNLLMQGGPN